jgi:ABC-2 type transport system ATP-binding protein
VTTIVLDGVSRWFGDRVAVADVSFTAGPGVTGLLGHNGAGKTTALRLVAGFTSPSRGRVRVGDADPRVDRAVFRQIGLVPDGDGLWPFLTAHAAVTLLARLRGLADPAAAAERALDAVGLGDVAGRRLAGFSKGMRQGVKLAQALVHEPRVLLLDEPLNGLDPPRRRHVVDLIRRLGDEGRTVLVSSHVLHEVERMAPRVVVLVNGRLVAEGETAEIRALLADRPRAIRIDAGDGTRTLLRALIGAGHADAVCLEGTAALVETADPDALARALPVLARDEGVSLRRVEPIGDDLESVYAYLHARARGAAR